MHELLTTLYGATGVPESAADKCTDGGHEDQSHAIDFSFWKNALSISAYGIKGSFGGSKVTIAQMCATDCPMLCGMIIYVG